MALDATEVVVASNGSLNVAAVGATAPTDNDGVLTGFTELGYASEDGVTLAQALDTEDIAGWQSAAPLRRIVTGSTLTIAFTLVQSNPATMALFFNATVSTDDLLIPISPTPLERALVLDWIDGAVQFRLYVPRVTLSETGEATLARGDAVGWPMTFTALPPATGTEIATVFQPPAA